MTREERIVQAAEALVAIRAEHDRVDASFRFGHAVDPERKAQWEVMTVQYALKHIKAEEVLKAAVEDK
jgi:hypothetical protein